MVILIIMCALSVIGVLVLLGYMWRNETRLVNEAIEGDDIIAGLEGDIELLQAKVDEYRTIIKLATNIRSCRECG